MIDNIGRSIDYIRISITDRCNLRCVYCMPEEGVESITHNDILSFEEILRIVQTLSRLGFKKVKITGGEPLVRKGCPSLIRALKDMPGIDSVTLTTNGILLADQMEELAFAGLDSVNISLDTLDREEYEKITRRDGLDQTLAGIREALKYPEVSVKINCVPMGQSEEQILSLANLAKEHLLHVRYIEMMPIGLGSQFDSLKEAEILSILQKKYGMYRTCDQVLGNGPGHYYEFDEFQGKIGFISAISHKFCEQCNRVRLTADGYLKACLQYPDGAGLKQLMRNGGTDQQLEETIRNVLLHKPTGHHFTEKQQPEEARIMAQIGG